MRELRNSDAILAQFNQLLRELLGDGLHRHTFRPWEIEILLDIESWDLKGPRRGTILRRYQKAVQRMMAEGARMPLRFAEYMQGLPAGGVPERKPPAAAPARSPSHGLKLVAPPAKKSRFEREHLKRSETSSFPLWEK